MYYKISKIIYCRAYRTIDLKFFWNCLNKRFWNLKKNIWQKKYSKINFSFKRTLKFFLTKTFDLAERRRAQSIFSIFSMNKWWLIRSKSVCWRFLLFLLLVYKELTFFGWRPIYDICFLKYEGIFYTLKILYFI